MNSIYLTILFPLIGMLNLLILKKNCSKKYITIISISNIFISMVISIISGIIFFKCDNPMTTNIYQYLYNWINIGGFNIPIIFNIDLLSMIMIILITVIGFLVYVYSCWYMNNDSEYSKFFIYMNLFISSMLLLVVSDNLIIMYIGWELVGLCSYLLIGFYYQKYRNSLCAIKAFIITKLGDILLIISLFMLYQYFNTLNIHTIKHLLIIKNNIVDINVITCVSALLLIASISKSAQFPLQVWLSDAMVGPTPASSIIHSATMVTAGVYLIIRLKELFILSPMIMFLIGLIGSITLLLSGFLALIQNDIKRILAYSTISQIGYMFIAISIKDWSAAIFHLISHAFFKSFLFLTAGSLIKLCNYEQNIFKMGLSYKDTIFVYICFIVGGLALSGIPIVTIGFYSKESILLSLFINKNYYLLIVSLLGIFITSLYTFRMIFSIFHRKNKITIYKKYNFLHTLPLSILLILVISGVFIHHTVESLLHIDNINNNKNISFLIFSGILPISGLIISYILWVLNNNLLKFIRSNSIIKFILNIIHNEYGLNWIYNFFFVIPYCLISKIFLNDPLGKIINKIYLVFIKLNILLQNIHNGQLRWYISLISLGAFLIFGILVL